MTAKKHTTPARNPSPNWHLRNLDDNLDRLSQIDDEFEAMGPDSPPSIDQVLEAYKLAVQLELEGHQILKTSPRARRIFRSGGLENIHRALDTAERWKSMTPAYLRMAVRAAGPVSNPRHGGAHYFVVYDGKGKVRAYTQTAQEAREESARYKGGSYKHL